MGKLTRIHYAILDGIIEERGHEWLYAQLMDKLVDGTRMRDIATMIGVPVVVLRGWIEKNCAEDIALAYRARADDLEWQATNEVMEASLATVSLAKLRADHCMKIASRLDKAKWGEKLELSGNPDAPLAQVTMIQLVPLQAGKDNDDG